MFFLLAQRDYFGFGFTTLIHADVIVYIFAYLHTALRIEGNMLDMN